MIKKLIEYKLLQYVNGDRLLTTILFYCILILLLLLLNNKYLILMMNTNPYVELNLLN